MQPKLVRSASSSISVPGPSPAAGAEADASTTSDRSLAHHGGPTRRRDKLPPWVTLPATDLSNKTLVVGANTTLPDLLNLIRRSNPKAEKDYFYCNMRSGQPHLKLVISEMYAEETLLDCKGALRQILHNTLEQYALTSAMEAAVHTLNEKVRQAHSPIRKHEFITAGQLLIGPSTAPRETPRMPTDCLMNLISALDRAASAIQDGAGASLIRSVLDDAKDRFLRHHLSVAQAKDFFAASSRRFTENGLRQLATLADSFVADMQKLSDTNALDRRLREDGASMVTSFITGLRDSKVIRTLPPEQGRALEEMLRQDWQQATAGLTGADALAFFEKIRPHCAVHGWQDLAVMANQCHAQLSSGEPNDTDRFFYTGLHENLYGRAIETFLMRALCEQPPARMRSSVQELGKALADKFVDFDSVDVYSFHDVVRNEDRFWFEKTARGMAFMNESSAYDALQQGMRKPVETGADCMAVAYLAFAIVQRLSRIHPQLSGWSAEATKFYEANIVPLKTKVYRLGQLDHDGPEHVRHAGVTLRYQPAAVPEPANRKHMQFLDQVRPDLENPSVALKTALEHGLPYATGISGVVPWVTHIVTKLRDEGYQLDPADIAAALALYLTEGGGHSLNEICLALVLTAKHLKILPEAIEGEAIDERYVTDYKDFFEYLYQDEPEGTLKSVQARVWQQTIAYYREHSHYEGAADGDRSVPNDAAEAVHAPTSDMATGATR